MLGTSRKNLEVAKNASESALARILAVPRRSRGSRAGGVCPLRWGAACVGVVGIVAVVAVVGVAGCGGQAGQGGTPTCPEGTECTTQSPAADPVDAASAEAGPAQGSVDALRPWFRGGPGTPTPLGVAGPETAPSLLWEVDLGAAITAQPTLAAVVGGEVAAFVGTHAGRFSGVLVSGPKAGTIAVDLNVPGMIFGTAAKATDGSLVFGADNDRVYAADPVAGTFVWSRLVGTCDPPRGRGPEGTRCDPDGGPTVGAGGDIYIGADGVYRLSSAGEVRWHYPPPESGPTWHVGAAPLVTREGEVFVGGEDGALIALDRDGALRWRVELGPDVDAAPVLLNNGLVVAAADDGRVIGFDQQGEERWAFTAGKEVRAALAVAEDGTIYAAALDGQLYALRPDGALRWSFAAGGPIATAPVVDREGRVYFGSRDDFVYAVDRSGHERWRLELPEDVDAALAISEGGVLLVGCDDGVLRGYR